MKRFITLITSLLIAVNLYSQVPYKAPDYKLMEKRWVELGLMQPDNPFPIEVWRGYKIDEFKAAGWAAVAVAGFIDGFLQGYEFDGRHYFEKHYGADPYGPLGSLSWTKIYIEGDPRNGKKPFYKKTGIGAPDFFHGAKLAEHVAYPLGGFGAGYGAYKQNKKWWHYALDLGAMFAINSLSVKAGLWLERH